LLLPVVQSIFDCPNTTQTALVVPLFSFEPMPATITTPQAYLEALPENRQTAVAQLRQTILTNLPADFVEIMNYGMLGYVVPHSIYPAGYHCNAQLPLPFLSLASLKSHIALYHLGLYADPDLLAWFVAEYPKHNPSKLNLGKSCLRFKHAAPIPHALIGELVTKMNVPQWIALYEKVVKK
jgi:hypothetical protein